MYGVLAIWGVAIAYRRQAETEEDKVKAYQLEQVCREDGRDGGRERRRERMGGMEGGRRRERGWEGRREREDERDEGREEERER